MQPGGRKKPIRHDQQGTVNNHLVAKQPAKQPKGRVMDRLSKTAILNHP
jgi:hypothetical protein